MHKAKVVEFIDIAAPRQKVFGLVMDLQRRLQLSPLWGIAQIEDMSPDFPAKGSSYKAILKKGDQSEYRTIITDYSPLNFLAYRLTIDRQTLVSWSFQDCAVGTRVIYTEEFLVNDEEEAEDFSQSVREVIQKWLNNIKRYLELGDGWFDRLVRTFLDRFYLKLRNDQRRIVATILFLQVIGMISFIMAAIAVGIAGFI